VKLVDARARVSLKNILYATDFSTASEAALPYALSIARRFGSKLIAVHVVTPDFTPALPPADWPAIVEAEQTQAREDAKRLEEKLAGIPHEVAFREGGIWEVFSEIIESRGIDLLVIGTHGREGVEKMMLGSVAEEAFRRAECPVLTVGPHVATSPHQLLELHNILYPTNFSDDSIAAAPYAISLAQEHQAQLALLHVLHPLQPSDLKAPENSAASLLHRLHALVPAEAELWCHPKCYVEFGPPADRILEFAKKQQAGLIVLGVRPVKKHLTSTSHFIETMTYQIVTQAPCPVFTVRG
jgi:nucleotide-binding universal stress UspA family protein